MWVKVMWLSIVEYLSVDMSLGDIQTAPHLLSFDPWMTQLKTLRWWNTFVGRNGLTSPLLWVGIVTPRISDVNFIITVEIMKVSLCWLAYIQTAIVKAVKEIQYFIFIVILQNEGISHHGGEAELGNLDKGSSCVQGPRGPAGPPGLEVGSRPFPNIMLLPALIMYCRSVTLALSLHHSTQFDLHWIHCQYG